MNMFVIFLKDYVKKMLSQLFTHMYHLEDNVYCNEDIILCRLYKLVIVFFKSQNKFAFYLLKRIRESNISNLMFSLLNAENSTQILNNLIGTNSPDHISTFVDDYEIKLLPQCFGDYNIFISYETQQSLGTQENKPCIVYLNDYVNINPVKLFRLVAANASPNAYAKNELVRKLKNVYKDIPTLNILLISMPLLIRNLKFITNISQDMNVHLLRDHMHFTPNYPALNFAILYLHEDRYLAEPLLPQANSNLQHFVIKKLHTLEGYF